MAHLPGVDEVIGELWGSSCLHQILELVLLLVLLISDPVDSLVDPLPLLADVPDHSRCRVECLLFLGILMTRAIFLYVNVVLRGLGRVRPGITGTPPLLAGLVRDFVDDVDGFLGRRQTFPVMLHVLKEVVSWLKPAGGYFNWLVNTLPPVTFQRVQRVRAGLRGLRLLQGLR